MIKLIYETFNNKDVDNMEDVDDIDGNIYIYHTTYH